MSTLFFHQPPPPDDFQLCSLAGWCAAPFDPGHISYLGCVFITIRIPKQTCFEKSDMKHWQLHLDGGGTQLVSVSIFHNNLSIVCEHNIWKSMKINMPSKEISE